MIKSFSEPKQSFKTCFESLNTLGSNIRVFREKNFKIFSTFFDPQKSASEELSDVSVMKAFTSNGAIVVNLYPKLMKKTRYWIPPQNLALGKFAVAGLEQKKS